jgi:hypothetical protein
MRKQYQVTLNSITGKYKPVSCIITTELNLEENKKEIINLGVQKICQKRYWTQRSLKTYGYLKAKVREYDKEKIAEENAARYEKIKEEKYAKGEWKKPKKEVDK